MLHIFVINFFAKPELNAFETLFYSSIYFTIFAPLNKIE